MPTYEYECDACGATFDVFQSIKSSPLRKAECKSCGQEQSVHRLIGMGGGIIFKGSGFYQTDYRSESYKKAAKAERDAGTKTSPESGNNGKSSKIKSSTDNNATSDTATAKSAS